MIFCPQCGGDRRHLPPIDRCPQCGGPGVGELGIPPPATPASTPPAMARLPGAPTYIPITPKAGQIALGILFVVLTGCLVFIWLPSKRPLDELEALQYTTQGAMQGDFLRGDEWRFRPGMYQTAYLIAFLIGAAGISSIVQGATYRAQKEVLCRRCRAPVIGRKVAFGVQCPAQPHLAEVNRSAVAVVILLGLVGCLLILAMLA